MSIVFCLLYTVCCITKLSPNFFVLVCGRILGGISTSILFSVFESWYIHQHTVTWKYPLDWVSLTFSKATFFNGMLAIIAGIVAQAGSDWLNLGPVAPFVIAIPFLLVASWLIYTRWEENYGERTMNWSGSCAEGFTTIIKNPNILALGLVQSLFESNMYIFVFLWTPVLELGSPPLGLTFSSFMICIMIGSSIYAILLNYGEKPEQIMTYCLVLMSTSFFVCSVSSNPAMSSSYIYVSYLSFLALEISVGMYFPCMSRIKSETIPDNLRANIMNWYRVPMNIITCGALLGMHHIDHPQASQFVFFLCGISAFIGLFIARTFAAMPKAPTGEEDILKNETC